MGTSQRRSWVENLNMEQELLQLLQPGTWKVFQSCLTVVSAALICCSPNNSAKLILSNIISVNVSSAAVQRDHPCCGGAGPVRRSGHGALGVGGLNWLLLRTHVLRMAGRRDGSWDPSGLCGGADMGRSHGAWDPSAMLTDSGCAAAGVRIRCWGAG